MNRNFFYFLLSLLILVNTALSGNQWSVRPIGDTFFEWAIDFAIIALIIRYKHYYFHPKNIKDYRIIFIYFVWMIFNVIRGMFVADNYWEWKQLVSGSIILTLPILVYVFCNPLVLLKVLSFWVRYAIPLFPLFFFWVLPPNVYHFYLGPVLLLACFIPILSTKWKAIFIAFLILMIFADFGARSQVIKAALAISMSLAYIFSKYISEKVLVMVHTSFYSIAFVLLFLGFSGQFNIFKFMSGNEGKYVEKKMVNGSIVEDDLTADTRTFIYFEVVESAIRNNYILWGRTPARGNDSVSFGMHNAEELKTGKYERHANEVCFPNVFTWLGLVGMILYCLIYFKSSYLAIYKSNSLFMKLIGVFISFRFLYGWVEDINRFDIMNITMWMMIAMGFSESFRSMSNEQFKIWIKSIFR